MSQPASWTLEAIENCKVKIANRKLIRPSLAAPASMCQRATQPATAAAADRQEICNFHFAICTLQYPAIDNTRPVLSEAMPWRARGTNGMDFCDPSFAPSGDGEIPKPDRLP